MSLETNIKEWVQLDNKHKKLNDEVKQIRDKKTEVSDIILKHCNDKSIRPTINISDGVLKLVDTQQANTLTYKFLSDCFSKYFNDTEQSEKLMEFIKNERTYTNVQSIKRTYN